MRLNPLDHPICLAPPQRLAPSQWIEHVPLGMFLVDLIRPRCFVELGVHFGVSYCAMCQAVDALGLDTLAFGIDTWTGDTQSHVYGPEVLADLRDHHDRRYGRFSALLPMTFDAGARRFPEGSIDLLHVDGCHTYAAVRHDYETWRPRLSERGLILFHDTHERRPDFGVWRLWEELTAVHPHFAVAHGHGLGLVAPGREIPPALAPLFELTASDHRALESLFLRLGQAVRGQFAAQETAFMAALTARTQHPPSTSPIAAPAARVTPRGATRAGTGTGARALIVTGGINHFFDLESRRLAAALGRLGIVADVATLAACPEAMYDWCFVTNPHEAAMSTGDLDSGLGRLASLRAQSGRAFAINMECLDSRWFADVRRATEAAGLTTLLDLGLHPQRGTALRPLPPGYRFLLNGLTMSEKASLRQASLGRGPRPLPWALVGLQTPARVRLAERLLREVNPAGFVYLPGHDAHASPGAFLDDTRLDRVLRRTEYYIWCSQEPYRYLEGQRVRQAVLAGAAPVKVLLPGEDPPEATPFHAAIMPWDTLVRRLAASPGDDLSRHIAAEFCALPSLEEELAALLDIPAGNVASGDAHAA